jgi:hypothetical protein
MLGKMIQEIKEARGSTESLSINARTMHTKGERVRQILVKHTHMRGPGGAMKDIKKRTKKNLMSGIADSIEELERSGLKLDDLMRVRAGPSTNHTDASPAKRGRMAVSEDMNLTGTHDEARQEQ